MRRGRLQIFSPGLVFELGQLDPEPDDIPIYHRKQLKFSGISTVYYDRACFKLDLPSDVTEALDDLSAVVKSKVQELEDKLAKAKSILEKVIELKTSENFLSSQEMKTMTEKRAVDFLMFITFRELQQRWKDEHGFLEMDEIEKMTALAEHIRSKLFLKEDTSL